MSTWRAERFTQLFDDATWRDLPERLAALDDDERAAAARGLPKALPTLRKAVDKAGRPDRGLGLLLAVINLDGTVQQAITSTSSWWFLRLSPEQLELVRRELAARGKDWVAAFVEVALDEVAFDPPFIRDLLADVGLPQPHHPGLLIDPTFQADWPSPGRAWERNFLATCSFLDLLTEPWSFFVEERAEDHRRIRSRLEDLRQVEPLDDEALAAALVGALGRDKDPRPAITWLDLLDLGHLLGPHVDRLLTLLPQLSGAPATWLRTTLLGLELDDDQVSVLALDTLVRREKGPKLAVLERLRSLSSPTADLTGTVAALLDDRSPDVQRAAKTLLESWQEPAPTTPAPELWRAPSGPPAVVAAAESPELPVLLQGLCAHPQPFPVEVDRVLDALVAAADDDGAEQVSALVRQEFDGRRAGHPLWTVLDHWSRGRDPMAGVRLGPFQQVAALRAADVVARLGRIPRLLSTTHADRPWLEVSEVAARARDWAEAGEPLIRSDVAVALSRLDPREPGECPAVPLDGGGSLADAVALWRADGWEAAERSLVPEWAGYAPPTHFGFEGEAVWLCPARLGPVIRRIEADLGQDRTGEAAERCARAVDLARPITVALAGCALQVAAAVPTGLRELVAAALFTAWDEERLDGASLAAAWPRDGSLPVARIVWLLTRIADEGGLAGVWPLMAVMAEQVAGADRLPPGTAPLLELVARLAPSVPEPTELPKVTALAASGARSKSAAAARAIVKALR
ncbi:hypothetical protein [Arachnia propionica]|uniref:Uncharacterized protein n=1 Tax=Arachnia propionica TaxID=1750 RepID=A0A3P1WMV9_9ACTN|nr:hypothetical protein [Arachnia propionica]RRD47661.1 hypothetical protein EII35_14650 [Arachnia propionica]